MTMDLSKIDPLVVVASLAASAITAILFMTANKPAAAQPLCNPDIKKSEAKVVDSMSLTDVEDLCKKNDKGVVAFCRCWRSKKFPLCDGSHNKFNTDCGDNTGPLVIKK